MKAQTTFAVDARTAAALAELQPALGVRTNAAVIRRSLALARIVCRDAIDGVLTVERPDGERVKILLNA